LTVLAILVPQVSTLLLPTETAHPLNFTLHPFFFHLGKYEKGEEKMEGNMKKEERKWEEI
jgi:hypothetical protein